MPTIQAVRNELPPFRNEKVLIKQRQGTDDIIKEIIRTHGLYESDYDRIYRLFDLGDVRATAAGIWNFLKYNLVYNEETGEQQSVKSPAAILHPGEFIDCKHYSLFAGGVLDAIRLNEGDPWTWYYRFVTDKNGSTEPTHVFVVINDNGQEIWLDPCLSSFDVHRHWTHTIDKSAMTSKIGSLVRISGAPVAPQTVTVNKNAAWTSFLTMTVTNMFSLKDLLLQNPDVTNIALRSYCEKNGFDFNQVINFIRS